ncbi:MAG: DUF3160 domain-containing protein, partial [Armatimonadia bacterium]|nr:DUF3160 domain-containing protein [Armatimonadia bacterium]
FLAGPADTIRLDQLADACAAAWGEGWSLEEIGDVVALRAELADDRYPTTRINTRASWDFSEVMDGKKIVGVLGEHYIPDSDLFMHTCRPRIPGRNLPSGLDVATALGSEAAAEKLRRVASEFPDVVPAAREFAPQMTGGSIYGKWLGTLETLFDEPDGLPEFAKTSAWDDKQINACLTSWAHLRHNYILYGAQAHIAAGMGSGSGIVEPLPRFFAEYAELCGALRDRLVAEGLEGRATDVLGALSSKAEVFERCAEDQLAGRDTSWAQQHVHDFSSFIRGVYFDNPLVIADVASSTELESVLHAASGPFYPVVALVEDDEGCYGVVGYVGSYYELVEPQFGRITDEEWKSRVEAEYARPEPPEWLAGLYPAPEEQSAARVRLGEIEALLRTDLDAGVAAAEAFMSEHRGDEWEPAAGLIAAQALNDAEQYGRTVDLLAELRRMYGSDARDAAKNLLRHAQWQVDHADREENRRESLEERLADTAPREGLSPEEELARQNARAMTLIAAKADLPRSRRSDETTWRRILDECPRSNVVPLARLGLVVAPWPEGTLEQSDDPEAERAAIGREIRPKLAALVDEYEGTPWERTMRVMHACTFMMTQDYMEAWERVTPLLDMKPGAQPDDTLLRLTGDLPLLGRYVYDGSPDHLAEIVLRPVLPQALDQGNLPLLRQINELLRQGKIEGGHSDEQRTLSYYLDEPEALAQFGPCLALEFDTYRRHDLTVEERARLMECALQVAEDHPGTKTAPGALAWAWYIGRIAEEHPRPAEIAATAQERLAEDYPDSLENLLIRSKVLTEQQRWDEAQRLYARAAEIIHERREAGVFGHDLPTPLEHLDMYHAPAVQETRFEEGLAWRREQWGEFVEAAGLPEDYLVEHTDRTEILRELLERLPGRGLGILEATEDVERVWSIARPILEAHPDDPRTFEMRWEVGTRTNLLWIAAQGPDAPHYEEAVARFVSSYPHMQYNRELRTELTECRQEAAEYAGTPAEVLALECAGRAYLRKERPEQAVEFLADALERVEEGRPLRERLVDALTAARRQVEAKEGAPPRKLWEAKREVEAGRSGQDPAPMLMHDGRVIIEGRTEQQAPALVCRDADSGETAWRAPVAPPGMLAAEGDALIVGTEIGLVQCLDAATGDLRWTHEMGIDQSGTVLCAASADVVVATWQHGLLKGIDLRTGEELWRNDLLPPARGAVLPAVHGRLAYVWDAEGQLHALGMADGAEAWTWDPRDVVDAETRLRNPLPATPAVVGGRLFASLGGRTSLLAVLEPDTGEEIWRRQFDFSIYWPIWRPSIELPGGRLLARSSEDIICASAEDGREVWSLPMREVRSMAVAGKLLVVGGRTGVATVIDTDLGEVVAGFEDIGVGAGVIARERDGGLHVWALSRDALTAWEVTLPAEVAEGR